MTEPLEITVARVEERVKAVHDLLKTHIEKSCSPDKCDLNKRVTNLEANQKWIRRVGYGVVATVATLLGLKI